MAFPTYTVQMTDFDGTTHPSYAVALPAGVSAGELLIVCIVIDNNVSAVSWPGSWVEMFDTDTGGAVVSTGYLFASGGETSVTVTANGTADDADAVAYRIQGAHASTPPEVQTLVQEGAGEHPDPPSLTASWGAEDNLWIALGGNPNHFVISAAPANYSDLQRSGHIATATRTNATATEDPGDFTIDTLTGSVFANTHVVRPAAAASGHPARTRFGGIPYGQGSPHFTHGWRP